MACERCAVSQAQSLFNFRTRGVIRHVSIVVTEVVVEHTSVLTHKRHAQLLVVKAVLQSGQCAVERLLFTMDRLMHLCIEALQSRFQQPYLVLFLPGLLKDNERHGKDHEEREYRQIEFIAD